MTSPAPEHLPPDHRFREYQDNHYHDEDEHPGAVPPADDVTPFKKTTRPAPKKPKKWLPRQRRFEED